MSHKLLKVLSNKKLVGTGATLVVTGALLEVTGALLLVTGRDKQSTHVGPLEALNN